MSEVPAFEGTWEEILTHTQELAGRRVKLYIVSADDEPYPGIAEDERPSTGASLLKYAGSWIGSDLNECLADLYRNRSEASF